MAFSDDMDKALASMATARQAAVKSAFTTFQTAVEAEQDTHGSPEQEQISLKERLIDLARDLSAQIQ